MHVNLVESFADFEKLKSNWEHVYKQDPESPIFTSWAWFRGWFQGTAFPWKILACRPKDGDDYVAFLPLGMTSRRRRGVNFAEVFIGGNPNSDHTGFVCLPDHRDHATAEIAAFLAKKMAWDVFRLRDVFDAKVENLIKAFPARDFEVRRSEGQVCPYISLPDTWDEYVQNYLGRHSRKEFRAYLRDFERAEEYRIELANSENFRAFLELLIGFYRQRWPEVSDGNIVLKKHILTNCFAAGALLLPVLFFRDQPIAASALFLDFKNSSINGYMTARDMCCDRLDPGKRLRCFEVNYAIEKGFSVLDMLRGDEMFKKQALGAVERNNQDVVIHRKNTKRVYDKLCGRISGLKSKVSSQINGKSQ